MWHKCYALQTFPILMFHTYMVRCIVIMKAYHRPLTDILETLTTYQCTGTYHTYWILLEFCFISLTEQVQQYSLEIELSRDCCTLYSVPCILFLWNSQPSKVKLPLSKWSYSQNKLESCVSHFGLTCHQEGKLFWIFIFRKWTKEISLSTFMSDVTLNICW